jgi:hypothetical protein
MAFDQHEIGTCFLHLLSLVLVAFWYGNELTSATQSFRASFHLVEWPDAFEP